jgi:hypothetical protein
MDIREIKLTSEQLENLLWQLARNEHAGCFSELPPHVLTKLVSDLRSLADCLERSPERVVALTFNSAVLHESGNTRSTISTNNFAMGSKPALAAIFVPVREQMATCIESVLPEVAEVVGGLNDEELNDLNQVVKKVEIPLQKIDPSKLN